MERIVIRPRIQITVLVVVFSVFGLLGLTFFTEGDVVAKREWFAIGLGGVCIVGSIIGIWRALRLGVVIDKDGLRMRGIDSRDEVTPWSAVESVQCVQIEARAGLPLYAPVLVLAGGDTAMPLRALGSYSQQDAERKTEQLRRFHLNATGSGAQG